MSASRAIPSFADLDRAGRGGQALEAVFLGGSLSWGANASDPQRTSWRALTVQALRRRWPGLIGSDAAIGGTGSDLGMFRVERDVLARRPDLVFLDFTANDDHWGADPLRLACYERILRHLLGQGLPVVQVLLPFRYTATHADWPRMPRYQAHLALGRAYGLPQADACALLGASLAAGSDDADRLWPHDQAHPADAGYRRFAAAALAAVEQAVASGTRPQLPEAPQHAAAFTSVIRHEVADRQLPTGWSAAAPSLLGQWFDHTPSRWLDRVAECRADGSAAPLVHEARCRLVGVLGEADGASPDLTVVIDGRPQPTGDGKASWPTGTGQFGGGRLLFWRLISGDLPDAVHRIELLPTPGTGDGRLRLAAICTAH